MNSAPLPSDLRTVVAQAYRAFRHRAAPPFPLDVCLECCVSADFEQQLRLWPLAQITAQHLYEYNASAKSEVQSTQEVGHLLPRMLELLAEGDQIHHSIELSLDRLGRCPEGCWNEDEREVLNRFTLAYFDCILRGVPLGNGGRRWLDDALSVLLMFDIGGLATEPLLGHWLRCEDPVATVQFVTTTYWEFWRAHEYRNAFASDRPEFRAQIRDWLLNPDNRQRFVEKLLAPEFQRLADQQPPCGHTPFSTMVDGVFDSLTQ